MKRLIDIIVSFCTLLALLPLFIPIMIILRLTGEGKIFYLQERVGLHGKHFNVIKFATMLENSLNIGSGDITVRNDPRVLPLGKFLRKTKINELPQVYNILRGDMSLVGWRPLLPKGFSEYSQKVQETITKNQPGLTGIGSIVFRDEEAIVTEAQKQGRDIKAVFREEILPYKGELELWYFNNKSLWLDFKIIFTTAFVIFFPKNYSYRNWFKDLPVPESKLVKQFTGT